jgi:hypothetical protein
MKLAIALTFLIEAVKAQSSDWNQVGGSVANTGFSNAVSKRPYDDVAMIAFGDPTSESVTMAWTSGGSYVQGLVSAEQSGSEFGYTVAVTQSTTNFGSVAIGAPSYVNGTNVDESGAVSVYQMTSEGVVEKRGETIVGGYDLRGRIDPGFGTAVTFIAQHDNLMVVCNPNDNTLGFESPHGRCFYYSYTLVETDPQNVFGWIPHPDVGSALNNFVGEAGDNYGYDVAGECCINTDDYESYYIVGAPDGNDGAGYVRVVAVPQFEIYWGTAGSAGERCGAAVVASGSLVAFGCPGAGENNNGMVRVFDTTTLEELGSGILGGDGEKLGERGTMDLTTAFDPDIGIVVATAQGSVKQYFFVNNEWVETGNALEIGGQVRVSGGDSSGSSTYVAVSAPNFLGSSSIYEHKIVTEAPTKAPTPAPTVPGATGIPTDIPTGAPSETDSTSAPKRKLTGIAVLMASFSFALSLN